MKSAMSVLCKVSAVIVWVFSLAAWLLLGFEQQMFSYGQLSVIITYTCQYLIFGFGIGVALFGIGDAVQKSSGTKTGGSNSYGQAAYGYPAQPTAPMTQPAYDYQSAAPAGQPTAYGYQNPQPAPAAPYGQQGYAQTAPGQQQNPYGGQPSV